MIREESNPAPDDLSAPLGQHVGTKRRFGLPAAVPRAAAGLLAACLLVFVVWALGGENPLGGEPLAVAAIDLRPQAGRTAPAAPATAAGPKRYDGPDAVPPGGPAAAPGTKTVTVIDGSTGKRQEVVIPAGPGAAPETPAPRAAVDLRVVESSRHGPIPRVGPDGARPADLYARPVKVAAGKADQPRVALVVTGLGIGSSSTSEALARLPGPVTLAFAPYGGDLETLVGRARADGHEVLLQVPMEPFDYPDNDPGPRTLLTSLAADQNVDRLHWLMSRFQGYVGVANYMGARFTATEQALFPILRETAQRGLIYLDDGTSPRSLASQIAGANNVPFAKATVVIDAVPTAAEIDRALTRLEQAARERGIAVGVATALPVALDRITRWMKAAESRGIVLVPISAAAAKAKQS